MTMAESAQFVTQITRAQRQLHAFILSMVWNPAEAGEIRVRQDLPNKLKEAILDAKPITELF